MAHATSSMYLSFHPAGIVGIAATFSLRWNEFHLECAALNSSTS